MTTHYLKTQPRPFLAIWLDQKPYEIRKDDRGFRVGDVLVLQEWSPGGAHAEDALGGGGYSGRQVIALVIYKTEGGEWGLPPDLCVLGIRTLERRGYLP